MNNFIIKVNNYYQKRKNNIIKHLNPNIHYLVKYDKENYDMVLIYNKKNNNLLHTAKYHNFGIYNTESNIFSWAYLLVKDKRLSILIKKVSDEIKKYKLKFNVNTTNFKLNSEDLEEFIKIVLFLSKTNWFFELRINDNLIQYILIEDFIESYI